MKKLFLISALILIAGVAFGQTLKKGSIIAIRIQTVTLQPDVTLNQYLDFLVNEYYPEFEKNYPGIKRFCMIGDRGALVNRIASIYYFESAEVRAKYWPNADDSTPAAEAALAKMEEIVKEAEKYRISVTSEYTDWIIQ
ncbi:MAG: hypothetical protein KAT07_08915 [Calditrichia bacterium]|nr:hypothetical protein [Calditrichia bacterium]